MTKEPGSIKSNNAWIEVQNTCIHLNYVWNTHEGTTTYEYAYKKLWANYDNNIWIYLQQVDITISKNQALQILYLV